MSGMTYDADDYDSRWKAILTGAFPEFMASYFPAAAADIDWMMQLPDHLERQLWQELEQFERAQRMR